MIGNELAILQRAFHRECRSLAQYLGECWPWTHRGDREAQELVRSIIADERRWAEQLAELIDQRGGVPVPGTYPAEFTNCNLHFLALDHLLGRLAEFIERGVPALERDLAATSDDPPARKLLAQMLERKRGQVTALRKLAATGART
ncbi:MAG: ferritin-like domain-containing protein [Planctomycetes bacterium]|nr:ferritin-like domain-containing protein [Planctomycetota bacterium]